jgi:hypothetical protein
MHRKGGELRTALTCKRCGSRCSVWDFVQSNKFTQQKIWPLRRFSNNGRRQPLWVEQRDANIPSRYDWDQRSLRRLQNRLARS